MLHVLISRKKNTSKEIEQNIFLSNFFFIHDLQKNEDINVQQVRSRENLEGFFTKSLSRKPFEQLSHKIGFLHFKDDCLHEREK